MALSRVNVYEFFLCLFFSIRGGTILTVKGNYLDSVAAPVLKLTRLQQSVNINTDIVIKETRTTRFGVKCC